MSDSNYSRISKELELLNIKDKKVKEYINKEYNVVYTFSKIFKEIYEPHIQDLLSNPRSNIKNRR